MPKKQFLKADKKKSKHVAPVPTTSDEFLEAGVDFEEAGEKWRGGDAVKSTRFFVRALDAYEEGLKKFPDSFDLAYNKARLQYEVTQYPKLLANLPGTLLEFLETALESSKYALNLDSEDADALFTAAGILTDVARVGEQHTRASKLQEALTLYEQCIERQLNQYYIYNASIPEQNGNNTPSVPAVASEPADTDMMDEGEPSVESSQATPSVPAWARIVEPTTADTILDTLVAQINTLVQLMDGIVFDHDTRESIIQYYGQTIGFALYHFNPQVGSGQNWISHIPADLNHPHTQSNLPTNKASIPLPPGRIPEVQLAIANYESNIANLSYHSGKVSLAEYEHTITTAYNFNMDNDPQALCDAAEAYLDLQEILARLDLSTPTLQKRWTFLTKALSFLTQASKVSDADHKENIHAKRGDVELLRYQMSRPGLEYKDAVQHRDLLLKNASVYYKNAMVFAKQVGNEEKVNEVGFRGMIVSCFQGERNLNEIRDKVDGMVVGKWVEDALGDGIWYEDQVRELGFSDH